MASSLPIIAFENTLPNEILKHEENGFNVKNTEDLSKKIILILKNQKLQEKYGNMSKNMIKNYDWHVVINEMLKKSKN